jgi:hypothetical protein
MDEVVLSNSCSRLLYSVMEIVFCEKISNSRIRDLHQYK